MRDSARILTEFYGQPWAIMPERIPAMQMVLHRWASGIKLSAEEIQAATGGKKVQPKATTGAVAVLPVYGVIAQRMNLMEEMCDGGTSIERLSQTFDSLMNDESVGAIVLDIASPGGSVYGLSEFADKVYEARGKKKIVAVADSLAASAAYWVGTAAEDFYVTPSGEAGSIGVWGAHQDVSKMLEEMGVKVTLISAGKYKVEGNPYEPLNDDAKAFMQQRTNDYYDMFVKSVARNRKTSQDSVRNGFGQGRVLGAQACVKEGMADGVRTLDDVISELASKKTAQNPRTRAETDPPARADLLTPHRDALKRALDIESL